DPPARERAPRDEPALPSELPAEVARRAAELAKRRRRREEGERRVHVSPEDGRVHRPTRAELVEIFLEAAAASPLALMGAGVIAGLVETLAPRMSFARTLVASLVTLDVAFVLLRIVQKSRPRELWQVRVHFFEPERGSGPQVALLLVL